MSQRSLIEINHDRGPRDSDEAYLALGRAIAYYIKSGGREDLPECMTLKWRRHHSDPCPFDQPLEFERKFPRSRMRDGSQRR